MGIGGRVLIATTCTIARSKFHFESSVAAMIAAGKKLMATTTLLFAQFRQNSTVDAHRTAIGPEVVFALLPTVVIFSFATVYTVDYAAQAASAVVVTIPLVVLVQIFHRWVVSGLTTGVVEG